MAAILVRFSVLQRGIKNRGCDKIKKFVRISNHQSMENFFSEKNLGVRCTLRQRVYRKLKSNIYAVKEIHDLTVGKPKKRIVEKVTNCIVVKKSDDDNIPREALLSSASFRNPMTSPVFRASDFCD